MNVRSEDALKSTPPFRSSSNINHKITLVFHAPTQVACGVLVGGTICSGTAITNMDLGRELVHMAVAMSRERITFKNT